VAEPLRRPGQDRTGGAGSVVPASPGEPRLGRQHGQPRQLYDDVPKGDRSDFVFPAFTQVTAVADAVGIASG
jgi:hypothetical protein